MADRLDYDRVTQIAGDAMADDPSCTADLAANRLRWALADFDAEGWAEVSVMHEGGDLVAGASVHWSMLLPELKINPARLRAAVLRWLASIDDAALYERMRAQVPELGVDVMPMAAEPEMFVVLLAVTREPLFKVRREHLEDAAGVSEGWSRPDDGVPT